MSWSATKREGREGVGRWSLLGDWLSIPLLLGGGECFASLSSVLFAEGGGQDRTEGAVMRVLAASQV